MTQRSYFQFEPHDGVIDIYHYRGDVEADEEFELKKISTAPDSLALRQLIQSSLIHHNGFDLWIEPDEETFG